MRYYNTTGIVRAIGVSHTKQPQLVEFYVETISLDAIKVLDATGREYTCQVSPHPRGKKSALLIRWFTAKKGVYLHSCAKAKR